MGGLKHIIFDEGRLNQDSRSAYQNPRKGTETSTLSCIGLCARSGVKNHNPRKGTETLPDSCGLCTSLPTVKNLNPRI